MKAAILRFLGSSRNFIQREYGQSMVEYALIVALIAFGATVALQSLGSGLNSAFTNISSTLASSLT